MILPDLNLLLYAYNPHAEEHEAARSWWEQSLNGDELIGLPHELSLGFVRIATHPRLGPAKVSLKAATAVVESWWAVPNVRILLPGENHAAEVFALLKRSRATGPLTSDAVLAVYAIAHRATLYTNDGDFSRFPGLDWRNPLTEN
ncbi:MAG: TA system VapC family ribonuclease toxin [Opitutales bacterium]